MEPAAVEPVKEEELVKEEVIPASTSETVEAKADAVGSPKVEEK